MTKWEGEVAIKYIKLLTESVTYDKILILLRKGKKYETKDY